jgi:hypothetical membrane protein
MLGTVPDCGCQKMGPFGAIKFFPGVGGFLGVKNKITDLGGLKNREKFFFHFFIIRKIFLMISVS